MKKIIYGIMLAGTILTGCISKFEEYNTDPNSIPEMNPSMLIPSMYEGLMCIKTGNSQFLDQMVGSLGGYFVISNRFGGELFDTFNPSDSWNATPYSTQFTTIYANFFEIQKMTEGKGHYFAMAKILRAASMIRVTDLYGPIPYSKVADGLTYVEYDSHEDVYKNIIKDLQDGAETLCEYVDEYPTSKPLKDVDVIFGGDYSLWARFANTLALRVAMRSSDKEAFNKSMEHRAGIIENNTQNAISSVGKQSNPYQMASASWGDLRINSSIVDYMEGYNDPRMDSYFTKSTFEGHTDRYIGQRAGDANFQKSEVAGYSMPKYEVSSPVIIFVAAETKFLLAEAALKGWITGDPKTYYEEGIRLSMEQYGVPSGNIDTYIADATSTPADHANDPRGEKYTYDRQSEITIAWDESATTEEKLERIITQKWIANYPMGLESWAEFRRTGYPELAPAMDNLSDGVITDNFRGMRRLRYPYTEKDYNLQNYEAAVQMIGGKDDESVELFWGKQQ